MVARKKLLPRKRSSKKAKEMQSFKLAKSPTPFLTINFSQQSVYWIILGIVVIAFTLWSFKLQNDIQAIYDSITVDDGMLNDTPIKRR